MSTTYAIFRKGLEPLKIQNLAGGLNWSYLMLQN